LRRGLVAAAVAATGALQWATPLDLVNWHFALPRLYYLPIVLAALYEGWVGGLATALMSGALLMAQTQTDTVVHHTLETVLFCAVGTITGGLAERLRAAYKRLELNLEAMKRAERLSAIGQLSAGLAHEIRNPLASIAGAASILGRAPGLEEKGAKCVSIINTECKRLDGLLTNFLNFARPRPPKLRDAELEPLLDNVLALAEHRVGRRGIECRKQVRGRLPRLHCDPEQLEQVLLNLMINAIEASEDGSAVTLEAGADRRAVWVRVVDEGSGVAAGDVERLFDPFFTTKENGTGLGLPVAHQIVQQMGGSLIAKQNSRKGMTFSVTLPVRRS